MKSRMLQLASKALPIMGCVAWLGLTGCASTVARTTGRPGTYPGARTDAEAMEAGGIMRVLAVLDLPVSGAVDTLLLPVDLMRASKQRTPGTPPSDGTLQTNDAPVLSPADGGRK